MKLRGHRECTDCGRRWSYFQTGGIECPNCGSLRSQALEDEPVLHTAGTADLDLTEARSAVDSRPIREVAALAADASRSYLTQRGFIEGGELQPLDEMTVAVAELRRVAERVKRSVQPDDNAERFLVELLREAPQGDRPAEVPPGLEADRGLGIAAAVDRYRTDLSRYLDEHPDGEARRVLGTVRDHQRRVQAVDGAVPIDQSERLLEAVRELGRYLREDEAEAALARAEDRLRRL